LFSALYVGSVVSSRVLGRVCTRRSELGVQEHELYIVAEQPRREISTKLMKSAGQKKDCSKERYTRSTTFHV
jgi:hypothetical protein